MVSRNAIVCWMILFILKDLSHTSVKKEHVFMILFDLEKAYNTTWKQGSLSELWDLGFSVGAV